MRRRVNHGALLLASGALVWACADRPASPPTPPVPRPSPAPTERRVAEAIAEATDSVTRGPDSPEAWGRLGNLFDAHAYLSEAVQCYRRALELDPDDFRWSYHLAVVLDLEAGDAEEVARLFRQAAAAEPDYPPTHHRLSVALQRRGLYDEACDAARRAIELDPDRAAAWRQLGQVRLAQGDLVGATEALEQAVERESLDGAAYAALAQARRRLGDDDAARAAAARAQASPTASTLPDPVRAAVGSLGVSANRAYERAQAALESGNLEEAIELLQIKQEVSPGPSSTHLLGVAHRRIGHADEATAFFEQAISMNDHPESHWQLGEMLIEQENTAEGVEHLRRARDLAAGDTGLLHAAGAGLARSGHLKDAIAAFAEAALLAPGNASLETDWCGALLQLGEIGPALDHCRQAVSLDPSSARAHLHMGLVLESGGQTGEARQHYERAVELDPESRARVLLTRPTPNAEGSG